jgi:hypothetical protein
VRAAVPHGHQQVDDQPLEEGGRLPQHPLQQARLERSLDRRIRSVDLLFGRSL